MSQSTIGVIGLGTMGAALARNLASRQILTSVFNRTYAKTQELERDYPDQNLVGFEELSDFVSSLEVPRKIILMVNAGGAVDQTIEHLLPLISPGDTLIDCGNSNWHDTEKRQKDLKSKNINFIGCGVSGGEEGALLGPSIMPGGVSSAVESILPILEQIAAKDFQGQPCVTNVGLGGAGHFVKMVHNGIEYAMMQGIAEVYDLLRHINADNIYLQSVFEKLNSGQTKSFLLDITVDLLSVKDAKTNTCLIDQIKPNAGAKGTGKWTVEAAMDLGIATPNIAAALFARVLSSRTHNFVIAKLTQTQFPSTNVEITTTQIELIHKALLAIYYTSYLQGLDLILEANKQYRWNINLGEVIRIWQGGCIIRSQMLQSLRSSLVEQNTFEDLGTTLTTHHTNLVDMFNFFSKQEFCLPLLSVFDAALDYCGSLTIDNLPTNLTQAQRDYFGAHTYQRIDQEGVFTGGWQKN